MKRLNALWLAIAAAILIYALIPIVGHCDAWGCHGGPCVAKEKQSGLAAGE